MKNLARAIFALLIMDAAVAPRDAIAAVTPPRCSFEVEVSHSSPQIYRRRLHAAVVDAIKETGSLVVDAGANYKVILAVNGAQERASWPPLGHCSAWVAIQDQTPERNWTKHYTFAHRFNFFGSASCARPKSQRFIKRILKSMEAMNCVGGREK